MVNKNYFKGTIDNPYHLSVGAVLVNDKGEICCHYFKSFIHKDLGSFTDFYILMRETMEVGEKIEDSLKRGLQEEFGAKGEIKSFLGSTISNIIFADRGSIEKTTLYFLCDLVSIDESLRAKDDPEAKSEIRWVKKEELIKIMREQGKRFDRQGLDESVIIKRI